MVPTSPCQSTGKVAIKNLVLSPLFNDLFALGDPQMSEDAESSNIFSALRVVTLYEQFLNLDQDSKGYLERCDLAQYGKGTLTDAYLDALCDGSLVEMF